jgi:hypothetical protein
VTVLVGGVVGSNVSIVTVLICAVVGSNVNTVIYLQQYI